MRRKINRQHNSKIRQLIKNHIFENIGIYFRILIIFIIGVCIGITIVNQLPETNRQGINQYISNSITAIKNNVQISKFDMLKSSILKNIIIVLLIWFFSLTMLGNFALYIITLFIGTTFGYVLSALMTSFTFLQGVLFFFSSLFLQNVLYIPATLFLILQGIKSYRELFIQKTIQLKYILIKNSVYAIITLFVLIVASFIEVYVSGNLVYRIIKYI